MMETIDVLQKKLNNISAEVQQIKDSLSQWQERQSQTAQSNQGNSQATQFASAERKGAAYPLEGHVMGKAAPKTKDAYLSLLLFTWSLLQPEAKEADAGLVTVARVRKSLSVDTSLYELFCHMRETSSTDLGNWFQVVDKSGGKSAYLLDTLVLCQEMKAENDRSYGKLSQLYLLMGCNEPMLGEAIEAAGLIHERDRYEYLQREKHQWKSFDGNVGECYLNLVGDLNTPGEVASTSYYALWPERAEGATGISKYAPKVMLKIEVAEGALVEKGQTLFTVYGAKESLKRGFLSNRHEITYSGTSDWGYILVRKYNRKLRSVWAPLPDKEWSDSAFIKDEQKQLDAYILNTYELLSVKADRDGIVHWQSCVNKRPFWSIEKIDYEGIEWRSAYWSDSQMWIGTYGWMDEMRKKGVDSIDLQPGNIFVSSPAMTPATIGEKPLCVIEKM